MLQHARTRMHAQHFLLIPSPSSSSSSSLAPGGLAPEDRQQQEPQGNEDPPPPPPPLRGLITKPSSSSFPPLLGSCGTGSRGRAATGAPGQGGSSSSSSPLWPVWEGARSPPVSPPDLLISDLDDFAGVTACGLFSNRSTRATRILLLLLLLGCWKICLRQPLCCILCGGSSPFRCPSGIFEGLDFCRLSPAKMAAKMARFGKVLASRTSDI